MHYHKLYSIQLLVYAICYFSWNCTTGLTFDPKAITQLP